MRYYWKTSVFLLMVLTVCLLSPQKLPAEFYRFVDKNGQLHFVDDQSKIPPEYRDNITVYKEKHDHLSEKERSIQLKKEEKRAEKIRIQRAAEEELLKKRQLIKAREQQKIAKEKKIKSSQTKVTIDGIRILVPVKLGYKGKEVEALLLLDTGASITTIHQQVADQLSITYTKRAEAKVVSGKMINFKIAKLSHIKVGPFKLENKIVGIIKHKGPSFGYKGLLGMNFLRHYEYSVDFDEQVINWKQ